MARPRTLKNEHGFTIIEVMVAAAILLVGILGVTTMVDTANRTTTSNKAREQGLALARELIESARSVKYQNLRPSTVVSRVQAMPGFANAGAGAGWTIKRRNIVYHVSLGVCSVDDTTDTSGAHAASSFCSRSLVQATPATCRTLVGTPAKINGTGGSPGLDGGDCGLDVNLDGQVDNLVQAAASTCPAGTSVPAGTCDAQPDDFKRLVTLVTWDRGAGSRSVLQQATVPFPGLSAYAAITGLTLNGYSSGANGYEVSDKPGSLTFTATSSQASNQVNWLLGGVDQGPIAGWSGTSGSFTWSLGNNAPDAETAPDTAAGEILDGTYSIGSRVQDAAGIHGLELDVAVVLNRRIPFPPGGFAVVDNGSGGIAATWNAPPDHDLVGYRLFRTSGSGSGVVPGCDFVTARTCTDTNPPSSATVTYWVKALDLAPGGAVREGQSSATASISKTNTAPSAPTNLAAALGAVSGSQRGVTLTWTAATDPDGIQKYAIYRDGVFVSYSNGAATTYSEQVKKNSSFDYQVSAIDSKGLEGPKTAVLTVNT
jgi:prepilin-type N-terminal cleavage/methylation domain-containing protein